ncbi:MAG: ADP-ribosylglycohydrolase family protein [Phycisphaeraceae bacterium]|nr:ADP-ribosylglycohydrolase family protein [Phycisphaeraceae bacterium]
MQEASALERFVMGAMVGDALGLPYERLGRGRVRALLGDRPLRHRMLFGRGLVSDDTEHTLMTMVAFHGANGDSDKFGSRLAWWLRLWVLSLPPATGKATLLACGRLLVGHSYRSSGVDSAGNGPTMRAGVLGLLCDGEEQLCEFIKIASRVTHADDRAEHGALAIALAARANRDGLPDEVLTRFRESVERLLPIGEMKTAVLDAIRSAEAGESTEEFAAYVGCRRGVTGFVLHTVPVVLHAWLSGSDSYLHGVERIVRLGGDTDTCAALLGGLLAIRQGVPDQLIEGIVDFPVSHRFSRGVSRGGAATGKWRFAVMPVRNLVFLGIVLIHAARRLAPPYG